VVTDGREALDTYNKNGEKFDIVITDIQMPNMNGIELSREIIKQNKKQKILITSAYNETEYFIELIKIGVSGFMQKPLNSIQMFEVIYEICQELSQEVDENRYIKICSKFSWDKNLKLLYRDNEIIQLTSNETMVMELFITNIDQIFTDLDIFNHIYFKDSEKEFSSNSIKSLVKRLRKKIPQELIKTHKNLGYSLTLTLC